MKISQVDLANRLLYLPLDLREKVLLWLTYKGLKPVSELTVERRGNAFALAKKGIRKESTYGYNSSNSIRIRRWIKDAGLSVAVDPKFASSWHVGKDKKQVQLSTKIIRKFDYENEIKSGTMFGFPGESVKDYAHNRTANEEGKIPMVLIGKERFSNQYLKDKYYTPYVLYGIPENMVVKESQTAKKWADTIRKDVPLLAKWFENKEIKR